LAESFKILYPMLAKTSPGISDLVRLERILSFSSGPLETSLVKDLLSYLYVFNEGSDFISITALPKSVDDDIRSGSISDYRRFNSNDEAWKLIKLAEILSGCGSALMVKASRLFYFIQ
jgi:hypothetical protein